MWCCTCVFVVCQHLSVRGRSLHRLKQSTWRWDGRVGLSKVHYCRHPKLSLSSCTVHFAPCLTPDAVQLYPTPNIIPSQLLVKSYTTTVLISATLGFWIPPFTAHCRSPTIHDIHPTSSHLTSLHPPQPYTTHNPNPNSPRRLLFPTSYHASAQTSGPHRTALPSLTFLPRTRATNPRLTLACLHALPHLFARPRLRSRIGLAW